MIKPSEKIFNNVVNPNLERIESYVDECILSATSYPVEVPATRSGWSYQEICAVADKYRAAGWEVYVFRTRGLTMSLSPRSESPRVDASFELP